MMTQEKEQGMDGRLGIAEYQMVYVWWYLFGFAWEYI